MTDKKTPLYDAHIRAGARMVPFAGYQMPVQYSGLVQEHHAVREAVGLFDVSHMGEVELRGPQALAVANRIVTNDLTRIADGQAAYTAMCRPEGGIIDDLVVYRFSPERVLICVNAANRAKDFDWIAAQAGEDCETVDRSEDYVQIAVQGPKAAALVQRLTDAPLDAVKSYRFVEGQVAGQPAILARTGYTGEDGFELYLPSAGGEAVWEALLEAGADLGVQPCGLGARDSLRLEFCLALYGNDIDASTNPYEAGLGWVVKLDKPDFVGKPALAAIKAAGVTRKLVPFEVTGRGIARPGYPVLVDGAPVGEVTSGTQAPSLKRAVGLCYLPVDHAKPGSAFEIEIRGKPVPAVVASRPLLKRPKKNP